MKSLFVILTIIGLFLLTGCTASDAPSGPRPVTDAKDILGTWDISGEGHVQYNEDGTFRYAKLRESLEKGPLVVGEFWFDEGQYFEKEIDVHSEPPCGSAVGIYEVQLLENGNLSFTVVEDECEARRVTTIREHRPVE